MEFTQIRDVLIRLLQPVDMAQTKLYDRGVRDAHLLDEPGVTPWGPIIKALDGALLAPIEYTPVHEQLSRLGLIRSVDGGRTWDQFSVVAAVEPGAKPWPWMGGEGPDESGLVRLADNRLYEIFRTGSPGYMGQAWSSDDGRTWTVPAPTPFKGVAPRIRRLSNGVLACTYGRPGPVTVVFNLDGTARTWSHLTPLFTGMSTRYTDLIEIGPGKLLVVYDSVPYGWDRIPDADTTSLNRVYGTFVDVQRK